MRGLIAIMVELMSHAALPCLPGFNGYERACCDSGRKNKSHRIILVTGFSWLWGGFFKILVEKMSHTALSFLPGFNGYERACCDSCRKNESHCIAMVTGF